MKILSGRLLSSVNITTALATELISLTINLFLNILLDGQTENLSRPPDFHHSSYLVLCFVGRAFVGNSGRFGNDGLVGAEEFFLLAHLGRLGNLCALMSPTAEEDEAEMSLTVRKVDQDELLVWR